MKLENHKVQQMTGSVFSKLVLQVRMGEAKGLKIA